MAKYITQWRLAGKYLKIMQVLECVRSWILLLGVTFKAGVEILQPIGFGIVFEEPFVQGFIQLLAQ